MRVYLVNPPAVDGVDIVREGRCMQRKGAWTSVWSPISLALCAAVLEREGFEVRLSDCIVEKLSAAYLMKEIKLFGPDLVVLNTATPSIESDLSVCDQVKRISRKTKTAVFGIHVTALSNEVLKFSSGVDFVVRGEPEYTVLELAKAIDLQKSFDKVSGITWRRGRRIVTNRDRPVIADLDELPFPAWHLVDKKNYVMPFTGRPFFLVATGRGCPYGCTFCADRTYYGRVLRLRSAKKIVDELEHDQRVYGVSDFLFWSESFTLNKQFSLSVCDEIISRGMTIHWVCNSRVDNVDLNLLRRFKKAGCDMIGYGIESGDQEVLDGVGKGTTLEQARRAVTLAHQAGLAVTGHCVVGLPGETKETIRQTASFALDIGLDFAQFYCAVPFPGSELYTQAKANGWIVSDDWKLYEQNFSVLSYGNLSAEEIMGLRREAYRRFYLSLRIVFRTFMKLKSFSQMRNFFGMALDFLNWVR